jgi:arsenite methyltransferase
MTASSFPPEHAGTREAVRAKYAARARHIVETGASRRRNPVTRDLYSEAELATLPAGVVGASLGCGNPVALVKLQPGEIVLDLGCGAGIDVLLAAQCVGPTGVVYGLDMTDEMLTLAEQNRQHAGAETVVLRKGEIEAIPLQEEAVDVVLSNGVINLSPDRERVLREAFRVLKPAGRVAVSDVVVQGELPLALRAELEARIGCIAGTLDELTFRGLLAEAGFIDVDVTVTRVFDSPVSSGRIVSAFVSARKPSS